MSQLQVTGEAKIRDIQGPVVANSGVVTALDGDASQYVRGDGTLADFPTSTGGGSSVSYYLNSSVSQGTIGGVAYRQLGKTPISGAGTDIAISADGYVASYITDANDPALLEVPAGNFNCEFYFSVNNNTGNPFVYAEVYKYDGTTFTLLGTSVGVPEYINQGTVINPYYFAVPVAVSALSVTDRISIRIYVNVDGRTVTLHTENNHLCQVVTTFSKGLISLNNLTRQNQFFQTGTDGTDFGISSSVATHTFNLPVASAANTGKLSSTDWSTFNGKVPYTGATGNVDLGSNYITSATIVFWKGTGSGLGNIGIGRIVPLGQNTTGQVNIGIGENSLFYNTTGSNNIALGGSANGNNTTGSSNIGIGSSANFANITGSNNIAIGIGALRNNTTDYNVAIGHLSSYFNTTGSQNVALGYTALYTNTTGSLNTAIGHSALYSNTTGSQNTALGGGALFFNTTGSNNTGIGNLALQQNTTGVNNTAIGSFSHYSNTTGLNNTAIGSTSLAFNTTGYQNTAIGSASLNANTTAYNNTAIGNASLNSNTTGINNTAIGNNSGSAITTGSYNTIIGTYIGTAAMSNNIVLADGAGNIRYQWNGTNNVFTGAATFSSSVTADGVGFIGVIPSYTNNFVSFSHTARSGAGDYSFLSSNDGTTIVNAKTGKTIDLRINNSSAMTITSGGDVGIGTSTINYATANRRVVEINGTSTALLAFKTGDVAKSYLFQTGTDFIMTMAAAGGNLIFENNGAERMRITSGGVITIANLAGTGSRAVLADASGNLSAPVSDISVKQNISTIGYGLNEILKMNPVWFDFIDDYKNYGEGRQNGNIAQEMQEIIPEAVFVTPSTGKMGINYDQMHAVYIKAIQELEARIKQLENK